LEGEFQILNPTGGYREERGTGRAYILLETGTCVNVDREERGLGERLLLKTFLLKYFSVGKILSTV